MRLGELFERQTWQLARIALTRIHKDSRARKLLGLILTWCVLLAIYLLLLVSAVVGFIILASAIKFDLDLGQATGGWFFALFLVFASTAGVVRSALMRNAARNKSASEVPLTARRAIFRTTFWLANLMVRCESEYALLKEMPPNIEIITRRVVLERLKAHEIWEEMPAVVRELLLKPDGHWTERERNQVAEKFEFLICLRWIARKSKTLPILALEPGYKRIQAREIATDSDWFQADLALGPPQIDVQLKRTAGFLERSSREGIARGIFPADAEKRQRAIDENQKMNARARAEDWLVGSKTVGEIGDEELRRANRRAFLRFRLLRSAIQEMTMAEPKEKIFDLIAAAISPQVAEK